MSSQEEIPDDGTRQGDFVSDGILLSTIFSGEA
jgi:hypothetical protein